MRLNVMLAGSLGLGLLATQAFAVPIVWTDWTSATVGATGSAAGTLSPVAGPITVSYSGDVAFAQLGTGTNYWTEGSPAPYTGNAYVDNAPTASEMIALQLAGTNTVTFSSPVENLVMAIVSQGRPNLPVTYDFDTPFTVLSEGLGYWGDGSYTLGGGDSLIGSEFHGVIRFTGPVSSLSWDVNPNEYWHGMTFGMPSNVPEPGSMLLLGPILLGYAMVRRRRKQV